MNFIKKIVGIIVCCLGVMSAPSTAEPSPEAAKKKVTEMFQELKTISKSANSKTQYESYFKKVVDKEHVSKNFCGKFDQRVIDAISEYFATMMGMQSVKVIFTTNYTINVNNVSCKGTRCKADVVAKHKSDSKKDIKVVVVLGSDLLFRDIEIGEVPFSKTLMSQIQEWVRTNHKKALRELSEEDRIVAVTEAIHSILKTAPVS